MPKVRYLKIRFSQNVFPNEIPRFRAAVIEKTKRESSLFHNHKSDTEYLYRYPLIQYKVTNKKASIICLNEGTDDIHYLLQNRNLDLRIGNKTLPFEIEDINMHYHQIQTWDKLFHYSLLNWLPLNQKNHKIYHELKSEIEKIALLNRILTGNLLSMAKGIQWFLEDRLVVEITKIKQIKMLERKGKKLHAFSLNFKSNLSLPDYLGIGKGCSVGFGVVKQFRMENQKMLTT